MDNYDVIAQIRNRSRIFTFVSLFSIALLILLGAYLLPNYINIVINADSGFSRKDFNIFGGLSWFIGFYSILYLLVTLNIFKKLVKKTKNNAIDFTNKNKMISLLKGCCFGYCFFLYIIVWIKSNKELERINAYNTNNNIDNNLEINSKTHS